MKIMFKPDDGSGSGGKPLVDKRNSFLQNMYLADFAITLTRDPDDHSTKQVRVIKNRYGKRGKADPETTINLCSKMIAMSVFGDTLKLFRVDLEEAIKKTILEKIGDAHDPFRRESGGDGT